MGTSKTGSSGKKPTPHERSLQWNEPHPALTLPGQIVLRFPDFDDGRGRKSRKFAVMWQDETEFTRAG